MPKRRLPDTDRSAPPKPRQSKLAKENKITPDEEAQIRNAFADCAIKKKGEKEGVIPIDKVEDAMIALDIPPTPLELPDFLSILDPSSEGFALFPHFVEICALKFHSRERTTDSHISSVDTAFELFMKKSRRRGAEEEEEKITLEMLRGIAKDIRVEVDDELLKDMILEANRGSGVSKGVGKGEFEEVMRRAGIWR